jgi:hypothetical protein
VIKGSDLLADKCRVCDLYLIVNVLHEVFNTADVMIEGYETLHEMEARQSVLTASYSALARWKELPGWKRLFVRKPDPTP